MAASPKTANTDSFNEIATVRIELRDTDPLIWREVEVPTSTTLKVLHDIIQLTIGWAGYHLWEFTIAKQRYGEVLGDDWGSEPPLDAMKVRLRDVLAPRKTKIGYMYDFGDGWEHRLTVSKVRQGVAGIAYPRYIGGEWNGPPEDCGGTHGFYDCLAALNDPKHPRHGEISEWLGEYEPDAIDINAIGVGLGHLAARRNAAAKRLEKKKLDAKS